MSDYLGWLYFRHERTQERVACPAVASERERGHSGGRFALVFKSPLSAEIGEWDEHRHAAWSGKTIESARQWIPISFMIKDEASRSVIETEINALLSSNEEQSLKKSPPDRRARRIKLDDWAKGWALDLIWDPFQGLASDSFAKLKGLELMEGLTPEPLAEPDIAAWLSQAAMPSSELRHLQEAAATPKAQAGPAPVAAAPAPVTTPVPAQEDRAPEQEEPDPFDPATQPAPARALAPPVAPAPQPTIKSSPAMEEAPPPFDDPAPFKPAPIAAPIAAPLAAAMPVPAAAPVPATPTPAAAALTEEQQQDERFVKARSVFGADDMFSLNQIAGSAAALAARSAPEEQRAPQRAHDASPVKPAAPAAPAKPAGLAFRCVRLPSESSPGRPLWHTALFACDSFLKKELFELIKPHWQGSVTGGAKKESLYSIDAIQELHGSGQALSLDGLPAGESHLIAAADGSKHLDAETFALHAFHQNPAPQAQALAARAKREILWSRLDSLVERMDPIGAPEAFDPVRITRDAASVGEGMGYWIDAPRGLVKTQQWADPSDAAALVDAYRHSSNERLLDRLASAARQLQTLPTLDAPEPADSERFMAPYSASVIETRQAWKASRKQAPAPTPAPSAPAGSPQEPADTIHAPAPRMKA